MEKKSLSRNFREEIAAEAVKYLRNRLQLKQRIIKGNENCMPLDEFMAYLEKCGGFSLLWCVDNESLDTLKSELHKRSNYVVLSKSEIDEILKYVRESIVENGLREEFLYSENEFVRETLHRLEDTLIERNSSRAKSELARVRMFREYFSLNDSMGFDKKFSGRIVRNDKTEFAILNFECKPICLFLESGKNVISDNILANEVIAVASELYFGRSYTREKNGKLTPTFSIFQERRAGNYRYMKAPLNGGAEYGISSSAVPHMVKVIGSLKSVLDIRGLSWLYRDAYSEKELIGLASIYNNHLEPGDEGFKNIEKATEIASEYWTKTKDEVSPVIAFFSKLRRPSKQESKDVSEEQLQAFKECLKKKIMMRLLIDPTCEVILSTGSKACELLRTCAKTVGVEMEFPKRIIMKVSLDKVILISDFSQETVLFDATQNKDMNDGSSGPQV